MRIPSYEEFENAVYPIYRAGLRPFSDEEVKAYFESDEAKNELRNSYESNVKALREGRITERIFLEGAAGGTAMCLSLMFE